MSKFRTLFTLVSGLVCLTLLTSMVFSEEQGIESCTFDNFFVGQNITLLTNEDGQLFKATNSGWDEITPPFSWSSVKVSQNNILYLTTQDKEVYSSSNYGNTWVLNGSLPNGTYNHERSELFPSPVNNLLLAVVNDPEPPGQSNGIWKSADNGMTWNRTYVSDFAQNISLSPNFAIDNIGFVPISGNNVTYGILKTEDGGDTWFEANEGLPIKNWPGVQEWATLSPSYADDQTVFTMGRGLQKTINGGTDWFQVNELSTPASAPILFSPDFATDDVVIFGKNNELFLSNNGGEDLVPIWIGEEDSILETWGIRRSGTLSHSDNVPTELENTIFFPIIGDPDRSDLEIWFTSRENFFGACNIYKSNDLGGSWHQVSLP